MVDYELVISFSDSHLTSKEDDKILILVAYIRKVKPEILVLNGDIFDPWKDEWKYILNSTCCKALQDLVVERKNEGLITVYINRNHDSNAKKNFLVGALFRGKYEYKNILFRHGYEFDVVWGGFWKIPGVAPLAFFIADKFPQLMLPIHKFLYGKNSVAVHEEIPGFSMQELHVETIQDRAKKYAEKSNKFLAIGHTHNPKIDGVLIDSGKAQETFVEFRIYKDKLGISIKTISELIKNA